MDLQRHLDGQYEIPTPFEQEKLAKLHDNYENALNRSMSLRKTALRNSTLKQTLVDTFAELISEKWIELVKGQELKTPSCSYLSFFVTKAAKPRVVYDGLVLVDGLSLNQAVLSGENLSNNLAEVLTRFRLGKFAGVGDLAKCFFQVEIPREQQDLFQIVWFKNKDMFGVITPVPLLLFWLLNVWRKKNLLMLVN